MNAPLTGGKTYNRDRLMELIQERGIVIKLVYETPHKYKPKTMVENINDFEHPRTAEEFLKTFFFHGKTNTIYFKDGGVLIVRRDFKGNHIWTYRQVCVN